MLLSRALVALVLASGTFAACSTGQSDQAAGQAVNGQLPAHASRSRDDATLLRDSLVGDLTLYFRPADAEREELTAALRRFAADVSTPDLLGGSVYRFTGDSSGGRYLVNLVSYTEPDSSVYNYLYELRTGLGAAYSQRYAIRSDDPQETAISEIADFDGDGMADVSICRYDIPDNASEDEAANAPGTAIALGYRPGGWYVIRRPTRAVPSCS